MEAAGEDVGLLLRNILPPNLDDAGLEDCALPPDSIHQAFLKAAASRASSCVSDSVPDPPSDILVGVAPEARPPSGPCSTEKGRTSGVDGGCDLVGGERNEEDVKKKDEVVIVGGSVDDSAKCGGCVEGKKIKERESDDKVDDGGGDKDKKPSLVEGYVFGP